MGKKSAKPRVIEWLFNQRFDPSTGALSKDIVTLDDVAAAISVLNLSEGKTLSSKNIANFLKDVVRNVKRANANWPASVFARGYTGRQETGGNACFRFIPIQEGQAEPFPGRIVPPTDVEKIRVESVSLPLAARRLGRPDETWLMQVLVRLRVIETHFCLFSTTSFQQIDHLQTGVKLGHHSEIDAVYLARKDESDRGVVICCEAKGIRDDILPDQLIRQVRALFAQETDSAFIVPIAAKVVGPSVVHVVEFQPVARDTAEELELLAVASQALYEFVPPVPGIGSVRKSPRHRQRRRPGPTT